ncbi:hypothetical protein [Oscillatoria sp. FACHB-1406]|uniref:hypothetical protein n=1 Tax=Oscillatoria sp. FACHB-1406 TaxID=2692846 RepID=UPI001682E951|nr:hypothetical protein [Oscillatoria sp. FACHB-1406]MBD2576556.1 hypothetical protein [Oscillatoria sp. FACHB-1406]
MAVRLKSWESPRRQGRNDKGKGGSARRRQLKKQQQVLRNKLKAQTKANKAKEGRDVESLPSSFIKLFLRLFSGIVKQMPYR